MTNSLARDASARPRIQNLRISFWGVQGSCPLFPETYEVEEYKRLVTLDALIRTFADLASKSDNGRVDLRKVLGGPPTLDTLNAYLQTLGTSDLPVYGGDTTCVSIETADGDVIVFDGGSGIRNGSKYIIQNWPAGRPREVHIFGTHEHLDHRSGLPFAQFCYVKPEFKLNVHGPYQFLNALDERYGVFTRKITEATHWDDPVDYRVMTARFTGTELPSAVGGDRVGAEVPRPWSIASPGAPVQVGSTTVTPFDVYHGQTRCVAYKVERAGATFVFCTDHEVRHGPDPRDPRQKLSTDAEERLCGHCEGADLAYFDGQYFLDEYLGKTGIGMTQPVPRIDWGHGCVEDVIDRAKRCHVRRALIGHHDPEREWPEKLRIDQELAKLCEGKNFQIELAKGEMVVDL